MLYKEANEKGGDCAACRAPKSPRGFSRRRASRALASGAGAPRPGAASAAGAVMHPSHLCFLPA
eukprot:10061512-Alexandrium_andersonii.AAC.1